MSLYEQFKQLDDPVIDTREESEALGAYLQARRAVVRLIEAARAEWSDAEAALALVKQSGVDVDDFNKGLKVHKALRAALAPFLLNPDDTPGTPGE